jgi:hypothetical protein
MVRLKRRRWVRSTLVSLLVLPLLTSCSSSRKPDATVSATTPRERTQFLLVRLAVLNPRVAEPLVKGFSAAALDRALGLVVATGVENAGWAEGLLQKEWWLSDDPGTRLRETEEVAGVLSEVRKMGPGGDQDGEERRREIREALTQGATPVPPADGEAKEGEGPGVRERQEDTVDSRNAQEGRAELEDAVRWVQFTRAWSSYYAAVGASAGGSGVPSGEPELALDQAVTMSLVRPDFLDRLAELMAEGLGS